MFQFEQYNQQTEGVNRIISVKLAGVVSIGESASPKLLEWSLRLRDVLAAVSLVLIPCVLHV